MKAIRALSVFLAFLLICTLSGQPSAQESPPQIKIEKHQLFVPRKGEKIVATAFLENPAQWLREKQRDAYGSLSGAMRGLRGENRWAATWTLIAISFGYGVFHAAGPGHGKTVITTWLLATRSQLKRGIFVSLLSSIVQALSAIAIVTAVLFVVGGAISKTRAAAMALESLSYALIAAMGVYLVWTSFSTRVAHVHHAGHGHDHHHTHQADCSCGHSHGPAPDKVSGEWSLVKAASMSIAIGIRPCTGAILVLLAAYPLGLYWAGIASVFMMAAGTFLTVSGIAAMTVYFRALTVKVTQGHESSGRWLDFTLRLGGGLVIAGLGGTLFWVSLFNTMPAAG
jgi:ABC-type nickel/cobalt efflux system permease component RcnA